MAKIQSFKEYCNERLEEEHRLSRRGLLAGALAAGAFGSVAKAANTPAGSPDLPSPEDSVGMIPQVRYWDHADKKGHMENFDRSFVYIRFTDSPDVLTKFLRDALSDRDKEYVSQHEAMVMRRKVGRPQQNQQARGNQAGQVNNQGQQAVAVEKKRFNPDFGPKPPYKNPTPIQVWKHQYRLVTKAEAEMARGKRPPVDYVILYKYYNGQMPDPPEE